MIAHDKSHRPICEACLSVWENGLYNKSFCRACSGTKSYRLRRGQYVAMPVKRIWIEKEGGKLRPIGIPALEDNIDKKLLCKFIKQRVNDGGILRLIGKWLNAGVCEEGKLKYPEAGTPQGGVISPLLSNIFLHHVLDTWFIKEVQPRLKGRSFIVRFADDFIIGCESKAELMKLVCRDSKVMRQLGCRLVG